MLGITVTKRSHLLLAPHIEEGDTVVDATLGRGSDAAFLARAVGPAGHLYGFDIQRDAVMATEKLLRSGKEPAQCRLHLFGVSHQWMDEYVLEAPSVIMFNLGYLPGGRKDITTEPGSTLSAITKGLRLLKQGGLMSIVTYKGHPEGKEEHRQVACYLAKLPSKDFEVLSILQRNRDEHAPELHLIQKNLRP